MIPRTIECHLIDTCIRLYWSNLFQRRVLESADNRHRDCRLRTGTGKSCAPCCGAHGRRGQDSHLRHTASRDRSTSKVTDGVVASGTCRRRQWTRARIFNRVARSGRYCEIALPATASYAGARGIGRKLRYAALILGIDLQLECGACTVRPQGRDISAEKYPS